MAEQMPDEQAAADLKGMLKIRRVGQTCITMFVVFVISLLAFGKDPLGSMAYKGSLVSCLGVVMGFFALIFLLANLKSVLRLPATKKALGLIGCTGLIVHTVIALFMPLSYGAGAAPAVGTAGMHPLAQSGAEEWVVNGKTYKIASTYFLQLPEGFQYTIEYPYEFNLADANMNDDRALAVALPVMKHAYTNGLYKRMTVGKFGEGALVPSRIGVVLFQKDGQRVRGYRVGLSLDQIKKLIDQQPASAATMP